MTKKLFNLRSVVAVAACLAAAAAFSSCSLFYEEHMLCVTEQTNRERGVMSSHPDEYYAYCKATPGECGQATVKVNTYDSEGVCKAALDHYKKNGPGGGGGGGSNAVCGSGYVDPTGGDIQSNSFCMMAYNYICMGNYSPSSSQVQEVCNTFKAWQSSNPNLGGCKYCGDSGGGTTQQTGKIGFPRAQPMPCGMIKIVLSGNGISRTSLITQWRNWGGGDNCDATDVLFFYGLPYGTYSYTASHSGTSCSNTNTASGTITLNSPCETKSINLN